METRIEQEEERQAKRRDKKKRPTMRVSGVGTKKLAARLSARTPALTKKA